MVPRSQCLKMNQPRKRKETSLLSELKELELLDEGEFVDIPELENADLIDENSMSIIVRCLNPTVHKIGGLVKALPPIWGLEESVRGRGVGENTVQFFFQHERDLHYVLTKGPWFVNGWIVSLARWTPNPGPDFLCRIPFWIRVRGFPVHLLKKEAIDGLLRPLGRVEKVELHAKNSSSVEYVRALVWINTEEPLQFKRTARFKSGEIVPAELEYEKLIKVCFLCKRLTHDQLYCPLQEGLAVDYRDMRSRPNHDTRQEVSTGASRLCEEELRPRSVTKRNQRVSRTTKTERAPSRPTISSHRSELERKGKSVMGASSRIWQPKSSQSLPQKGVGRSRSTEESSALPGSRSNSQGMVGTGASSGASQESPSIFHRLSGLNDPNPEFPVGPHPQEERPPSSVFERLGGHDESPLNVIQSGESAPSGNKRRRLSRSDERKLKKAGIGGPFEEPSPSVFERLEETPPSVFERLGSNGKSSGSRSSGEKFHSVPVTAKAPNRSAQRIVLGSGKIVEEGLMINTSPSSPI